MIKKHIREVAERRGIKNAFGLQMALEISPTVATKLWNGDFEMIGLGTLDKLCRVLKCQTNKLLTFEPDE
jgi:DNA-binding Xre family transcriptional regulator